MQERADAIRGALMQGRGIQVTPDTADDEEARAAGD
jgi:hypothetical protein